MTFESNVLIWMCVLIFANQLGFGAMVPSLPLYAETFGVSGTAIGFAIGVYGLARFVMAIPSGQISDKWGRKPALAIGGLLATAGNLLSVYATAYPEFLLARFIAGAGAGMVVTTGSVILADITTPARRGRIIAIYQGTFIFAVGIGPLPGGYLAQNFGLLAPFWFCALASFLAGSIALLKVKETRQLAKEKEIKGTVLPPLKDQLKILSKNTGFVLVSGIALAHALTRTGGLFNIVPIIGSFKIQLEYDEIGIALAVGSLLGLCAVYPAGVAVDRWGRKAIIAPFTFLTGGSFLLFASADSFLGFALANALWGIASGIGGSAPAAYAADSAPPGMNASAMSLFRMLGDIGYVVGPVILGFIVDTHGTDMALYLAAIILSVIGASFARFAPESYRPKR
ncbi:MAG: MFS transporter [Rhodospirillaceae bacterium]|nr:MFS transporter [Rhodospirillaceae bacterium]MBT5913560.1 MFS transporter [Rhodospirillaceae bacterium]MBT6306356.1 MFS transporter [Rhodospirillaceae bacterium]MDC0998145.1 MFS transporter [Alphaproteobacteria bacterium]